MRNRFFNLTLVAVFFSLFINSCDFTTNTTTISDISSDEYILIWSDEFNQETSDTVLDPSKWNYETGYGSNGWGNNEWQQYTDSQENIKVEDGNMIISAVYDSVNFSSLGIRDGSITSARVNTMNKFDMKFGKINARIKTPVGTGMWPAFWMLGKNFDQVGWPHCGEIDIMEMSPLYHDNKTTLCTIHWNDDTDSTHQQFGTNKVMPNSLADDYHIYEIEWNENRLVGRIDGMTYFVKVIDPSTMSEFINRFFIIFNVAVGGTLGGTPDDTTDWPQSMYVDWVRAYQIEESSNDIDTFGIFTDETSVDDGISIGANAQIYVWDNTLTDGTILPYEGDNVLSWINTDVGWYGAGIMTDLPIDFSNFEAGDINFWIKMPADVTFSIGINDLDGTENFVEFPANQTTYNLERDGEWGQVVIPVDDILGNVDIERISYLFMIKAENVETVYEFAIDDIYWSGGNQNFSSVSFNLDSYTIEDLGGNISVSDEAAGESIQSVQIVNNTDTISVDVSLNVNGNGSEAFYFGPTNDETNTIAISENDIITVIYTDINDEVRTDSAPIAVLIPGYTFGLFTDETPVDAEYSIGDDANIWVWSSTLVDGTIAPYEGENVLSWSSTSSAWYGAGIQSVDPADFSSYSNGYISFWIKIPANVTFEIGISDTQGNENYVIFPEYATIYNLVRNGEWGQVNIPISSIQGSVNLESMSYEFMIRATGVSSIYEFAIDDIYWNDGSTN